jgi:hypothetical protein
VGVNILLRHVPDAPTYKISLLTNGGMLRGLEPFTLLRLCASKAIKKCF